MNNPVADTLEKFPISESRGTQRLAILMSALMNISPGKWDKIKNMKVKWDDVLDELVPSVEIEFFDGPSEKIIQKELS